MNKPTSIDAAGVLMSLTQGVATWHVVVPELRMVTDTTVDDEAFMYELRRAELIAGGITVGVGLLGSLLLQAVYPALASLLVAALMWGVYEIALRSAPPL